VLTRSHLADRLSELDDAVELIARQWVRQEAYLKGVGTGIAHGLTTPRGDGEAAQAGSTLVDVPVAGGLSAAVAVAALSP
jgi:4'-phosphopantetheinyl transferase